MMQKIILSLFILLGFLTTGQSQQFVLEQYINEALQSNISLEQQQLSYQKSVEALKEARRMFFPVLSVEARYTRAQGGRTVEVPFGDLLNPAYSNLNLINQSLQQGNPGYPQLPAYPTLDNYTLNFIREREQDTRLQFAMPLYNPDLMQNYRIKNEMMQAETYGLDAYKRELVKEVKTAYIQYLQAMEVEQLYGTTRNVVAESLRTRESLYQNDKITIDEVYSARAQQQEVEKKYAEAKENLKKAAAWFNFLLNRDLQEPITAEDPMGWIAVTNDSITIENILTRREEILQLQAYETINQHRVDMEKGAVIPRLSLGAAFGYQGEDYAITPDSDFAMVNISLSWKLFSSGQRQSRINEARLDGQMAQNKRTEFEKYLEMELLNAQMAVQTQLQTIALAEEELKNHEQAFRFVQRRYNQGIANQLEYAQALNNRLKAQSALIVAQYGYLIQQVHIERLTATYPIH